MHHLFMHERIVLHGIFGTEIAQILHRDIISLRGLYIRPIIHRYRRLIRILDAKTIILL